MYVLMYAILEANSQNVRRRRRREREEEKWKTEKLWQYRSRQLENQECM